MFHKIQLIIQWIIIYSWHELYSVTKHFLLWFMYNVEITYGTYIVCETIESSDVWERTQYITIVQHMAGGRPPRDPGH